MSRAALVAGGVAAAVIATLALATPRIPDAHAGAAADALAEAAVEIRALEDRLTDAEARITALEAAWPSTSTPSGAPAPSSPSPTPSPSPSPTGATTPSPVPTATSSPTPTSSPGSCPTNLQAAIDATPTGGTLTLGSCTYAVSVTIARSMTVRGPAVIDGGNSRQYAVSITANDVTIDGLEVRNHRPPYQRGAINSTASRTTIRNVWAHDNPGPGRGANQGNNNTIGGGISLTGGTGHLIEDSIVERNETLGVHINGSGGSATIRRTVIRDNNLGGYNLAWHSGGVKATRVYGFVIEDSTVSGNRGDGIWCDIDCRDMVVRNNRVNHNTFAGIHYEISSGALIEGNTLWENGWARSDGWGWGAAIQVVESRLITIRDNTVAWNNRGISALVPGTWRSRTSFPTTRPGSYDGHVIADNVVIGSGSQPLVTVSADGTSIGASVSGTRYSGTGTLNGGGVVLNTAELDAILSGAGVPKGRS